MRYDSVSDAYDRLLLIPLRICLRPMDRPPWMLGRGINRGDLQHPIPGVHNIVPGSAGYQHRVPRAKKPMEGHLIPALSHTNGGLTFLNTNKLICVTDAVPNRFRRGTEYTSLSIADDSPSKAQSGNSGFAAISALYLR